MLSRSSVLLPTPLRVSLMVATMIILNGCFGRPNFSKPAALNNPGVRVGDGVLTKSEFLSDSRLGVVSDMLWGELDPEEGDEIGIAGSQGVLFADLNGTIRSWIAFNDFNSGASFVDVEGDGVAEYLSGGSWSQSVVLLDHDGKTRWTYGGGGGVDDVTIGDVDGDEEAEFVVGYNGGGGVHLLDKDGKDEWRRSDGNVWHVEMVDTNNDGLDEIVHSNAGGMMTVRDKDGNVLSSNKPGSVTGPYFSDFSVVRWPGKSDREYALVASGGSAWLFNFDGSTAKSLDAPDSADLGDVYGTPVRLKADQPDYFAVLIGYGIWDTGLLYLYDNSGKLVYEEILPQTAMSIVAVTPEDGGVDTLLVGGDGKVLAYRM